MLRREEREETGARDTRPRAGRSSAPERPAVRIPHRFFTRCSSHYGGPRPTPRRAARPKTAQEKAFLALGPTAAQWLSGSAASGNTRLAADLVELAALRAAHGEAAWRPPWSGGLRPGVLPPASARSLSVRLLCDMGQTCPSDTETLFRRSVQDLRNR